MISLPPFYIGQEIEAIENHPSGHLFKKGDRFTVIGIEKGLCKCSNEWNVQIGLTGKNGGTRCVVCKTSISNSGLLWFLSTRFRAITPKFQEISFSKVIEKELMSAN